MHQTIPSNSFPADTCFTANSVLKKCRNCGKTFKNLKLHLCKNLYDLSSIEAELAVRTKRRQSLYKQQNQLQISEKKKITGKIIVISLRSIMKTKKKFKKNKRTITGKTKKKQS